MADSLKLSFHSFIHSFVQVISVAFLQVRYYSEALPTQHKYCVAVSLGSATGHCELRTFPNTSHVTARAGFKPTTLRSKGFESSLLVSHHVPQFPCSHRNALCYTLSLMCLPVSCIHSVLLGLLMSVLYCFVCYPADRSWNSSRYCSAHTLHLFILD